MHVEVKSLGRPLLALSAVICTNVRTVPLFVADRQSVVSSC